MVVNSILLTDRALRITHISTPDITVLIFALKRLPTTIHSFPDSL